MGWIKSLLFRKGGDLPLIEAVSSHAANWIGEEPIILHERVSFSLHVDLYVFPAATGRPFHTVITSGMAEKAMNVPPNTASPFLELVLFLPEIWPINDVTKTQVAFEPIRILKNIVHYPHDNDTWLSFCHTVNIGEQPSFDPNLVAVTLMEPELLEEVGYTLDMPDGRQIWFLSIVFLLEDEWKFCIDHSTNELIDLAKSKNRINELLILTPDRKSILEEPVT